MKILFIGGCNLGNYPRGGQEYKNQVFWQEIKSIYGANIIDTVNWKNRPAVWFNLPYHIFVRSYDRIIISASSHSVYKVVRLLQYLPKLAQKTLYFVIGGYFPGALHSGIFLPLPYKNLRGIVVESEGMRQKLIESGLSNNIYVVPNFKRFDLPKIRYADSKVAIRFVFLSRIIKEKGILIIADAARLLRERNITNFTITFLGPIEPSFKLEFQKVLAEGHEYGGVLDILNDHKKAYEILSSFGVMLFPTYWEGEGFPGTLIDAFAAGLPVIASDWNANAEIIQHEVNGLLVPPKDAMALSNAMERLIEDTEFRNSLRQNSAQSATQFHFNTVWKKIQNIIES